MLNGDDSIRTALSHSTALILDTGDEVSTQVILEHDVSPWIAASVRRSTVISTSTGRVCI